MGFSSKFSKLSNLSSRSKWLLLEGFFTSIKNEIFLKLGIYKPIKDLHFNVDEEQVEEEDTLLIIREISTIVRILEKHAPWKPLCYNRALTAKRMLLRRNVKTNMHIGFRKKNDEFDGHAWLTFNDKLVTGYVKGLNKFKVLKPTVNF